MNLWLTTKEAATHLDVSTRRILQYIEEGRLTARKRAGAWFVEREALAKFQRQPAGRPSPHKEAILNRYDDGESVSEIAASFQTTQAAIYKLASRIGHYRRGQKKKTAR